MEQINIRQLTSLSELQLIPDLERKVWNMAPIPIHQTYTALLNGGIILGAYHHDQMIGFLYSFPGFDGKQTYLCSHMLGILPEYQVKGLGEKMKRKQAELAKQYGYAFITWTYDPLESKNAYLNIHKLGAVGATYSPDHYGDLQDELNTGLPTDRITIEWYIQQEQSNKRNQATLDQERILLDVNEQRQPTVIKSLSNEVLEKERNWFVAIPQDFQTIKKENMELAKNWRYRTREMMQTLFSLGFQAKDVIRHPEKHVSYYVFEK